MMMNATGPSACGGAARDRAAANTTAPAAAAPADAAMPDAATVKAAVKKATDACAAGLAGAAVPVVVAASGPFDVSMECKKVGQNAACDVKIEKAAGGAAVDSKHAADIVSGLFGLVAESAFALAMAHGADAVADADAAVEDNHSNGKENLNPMNETTEHAGGGAAGGSAKH